jgi:hypothetical protein
MQSLKLRLKAQLSWHHNQVKINVFIFDAHMSDNAFSPPPESAATKGISAIV